MRSINRFWLECSSTCSVVAVRDRRSFQLCRRMSSSSSPSSDICLNNFVNLKRTSQRREKTQVFSIGILLWTHVCWNRNMLVTFIVCSIQLRFSIGLKLATRRMFVFWQSQIELTYFNCNLKIITSKLWPFFASLISIQKALNFRMESYEWNQSTWLDVVQHRVISL